MIPLACLHVRCTPMSVCSPTRVHHIVRVDGQTCLHVPRAHMGGASHHTRGGQTESTWPPLMGCCTGILQAHAARGGGVRLLLHARARLYRSVPGEGAARGVPRQRAYDGLRHGARPHRHEPRRTQVRCCTTRSRRRRGRNGTPMRSWFLVCGRFCHPVRMWRVTTLHCSTARGAWHRVATFPPLTEVH